MQRNYEPRRVAEEFSLQKATIKSIVDSRKKLRVGSSLHSCILNHEMLLLACLGENKFVEKQFDSNSVHLRKNGETVLYSAFNLYPLLYPKYNTFVSNKNSAQNLIFHICIHFEYKSREKVRRHTLWCGEGWFVRCSLWREMKWPKL